MGYYAEYNRLGFSSKTFNTYGGMYVSCNSCFQMWDIRTPQMPPPPSILRHVDECPDRPENVT